MRSQITTPGGAQIVVPLQALPPVSQPHFKLDISGLAKEFWVSGEILPRQGFRAGHAPLC